MTVMLAAPGSLAAQYARVGDPHGVLLAGPPADAGAEPLAAHTARLGRLQLRNPDELIAELGGSGLVGRGGGGFPLVRKITAVVDAVSRGAGAPLVVVNASESEPASRKDETLLAMRPHLVLDGAAVAARAVGAGEVTVHLHRGAGGCLLALRRAIAERVAAGLPDPAWEISQGPARYVAGESSAVVAFLEGGVAKPRATRIPVALAGVDRRPTLLNNVETIAHLAIIARQGARGWRSTGAPEPTLVTVHGGGSEPGVVVEVTGAVTVGQLLTDIGGVPGPPAALLVGGYAGTWLAGADAWPLLIDRAAMSAAGAAIGCGLLCVLPEGACGVRQTTGLLSWLAGENAGQCGPCMFGLPALATLFGDIADGRGGWRALARLQRLTETIDGRGACSHPDGVVRLVLSAARVFAEDLDRHARRKPCSGGSRDGLLPLPAAQEGWR